MSRRDQGPQATQTQRASAPRPASTRSARPVFEAHREEALNQGATAQQAMLRHIEGRLEGLRGLADAERAANRREAQRGTWDDAADRHKAHAGWHQADDARWKEVATRYEAAAQAAARGDLVQAARRLNDAEDAEDAQRAETSRRVLDAPEDRRPGHPWREGVRGIVRAAVAVPPAIRRAVDDLTGRTPPTTRPWHHAPDRRRRTDAEQADDEEGGDGAT
jgi:hypothetical protein